MLSIEELVIDTKRLTIRPFKKGDFEEWDYGYRNRLPSQHKYDDGFNDDDSSFSRQWFIDSIRDFDETAEKDESYVFGIFRKDDGRIIGELELITILRMDYNWGMMGYAVHNQYVRQGYGKESVIAAAEFFFYHLGFHRIELHINIDNEPSEKLAKSAKFQYECTREAFFYENGRWIDQLVYVKTRPH